MSTPIVSIIVPCYNQAQYLDEALQSVFVQTYTNWECIIVNDGSPDNTEDVAKKWLDRDLRFVYIKKENGGLSTARNAGLEVAKGEYIQFLDSDDWIAGTKLEMSLQKIDLEKSKSVKVVISNFRMFLDNPQNSSAPYCNLNSHLLNFENMLYQWEESFSIPIHCGLFESSLFKSFRFPEALKGKEDWVMWVSLFSKDCEVVFIEMPLAFYRRNPTSMQHTKDMLPDFLKACGHFKSFLTDEEFYKFSIHLISRYYLSNEHYKSRWKSIKNSNSHQTGLMVKKVLKTLGLLKLFKRFIPIILKFKAK